ncbi:hypothetical protein Tco_1186125 [Tanacetum coccineum]
MNKGIVPTEMELVLEQTQQGTSHEVLVGSHKDGDGVILYRQTQVHYRMLILDQHIQRNHESSSIYQEKYEHVGPQDTRPQDDERSQDDDHRLDLADDLMKAQDHISSLNISRKTKTTTSNSRVPVPLPEDPYEAIRQAYLVETNTESEPFKGPVETKTPELPHIVASPTSLPDSTPPACHAKELEDSDTFGARSTSSDSTALLSPNHPLTCTSLPLYLRAMALSDSAFCKRYRSYYETPSSLSSLAFLVRKRYQGTSELILDTDSEEDEIREEDTDDDEGHDLDDKGHGLDDEGHGEEEAVPEGLQRAALVVETSVGEPLRLGYGALRRRELAVEEDQVYSTFEVGQGSGFVPEPERPERVSALRQPTLTTWIDPEDGIAYIDVPAYLPPAPPAQTPPSPKWSSSSLPVSLAPSAVPSPIPSPMI